MHRCLFPMLLGSAEHLDQLPGELPSCRESLGRYSLAVVLAPAPAALPFPMVLLPCDRNRAEPAPTPLLRLSTPAGIPSVTETDLNALGAAAELHFTAFAAR